MEVIHFPVAKPANVLRGAFGATFKRLAAPEVYARVFEPAWKSGPSGLRNAPRPFVFRALQLDGRIVEPGERFHFGINLFDLREETVSCLEQVMAEMGRDGLGGTRGRARLDQSERGNTQILNFEPSQEPMSKLRIDFLTPTELKSGDRIVDRPEFGILFARIRDRVSTLSAIYGEGSLPIDFAALGKRANEIHMVCCDVKPVAVTRRSAQTGQTHSLGGFVGSAGYEGSLAEFVPYLEAARWTGVGRQTVWGKGECAITLCS